VVSGQKRGKEELLGGLGVAEGPPEEEDVGLGLVGHVVDPALALLDPEVPPLGLRHQVGLGHEFGNVLGQDHVPVLELVVVVLVRVEDVLVGCHVSFFFFKVVGPEHTGKGLLAALRLGGKVCGQFQGSDQMVARLWPLEVCFAAFDG